MELQTLSGSPNNFGKRRKMSRNDSPNSSMFDVAALAAALDDEATDSSSEEGSDSGTSSSSHSSSSSPSSSEPAFDFYDVFDAPEMPSLDFDDSAKDNKKGSTPASPGLTKKLPFLEKRASLGKRSRGLQRSQTVTCDLCTLAAEENY
jgi:hypothetical protein